MENYNLLERTLHKLALNSRSAKELTFDIEKSLFRKKAGAPPQKNIFVTGLARAGTTIIMNVIYESGEFASLTYRDMPFVMAPNLWSKLTSSNDKNTTMRERAHNDGILISSHSPEALDEIFWSMFPSMNFDAQQTISPHSIPREALEEYSSFIALVCQRYDKKRYIAKNNNNIFRLGDLSKCFSDSLFLVPFREPAYHASNLFEQHEKFLNSEDFEARYMRWLGHFEFGANHKKSIFPNAGNYQHPLGSPNYWLETWINSYQHLYPIIQSSQNVHAVCYEQLDASNDDYFAALSQMCAIELDASIFQPRNESCCDGFDTNLMNKATALYEQLAALKFPQS